MAKNDEEMLKLLMNIQKSVDSVDKTTAVQAVEMKNQSQDISEIKEEQKRQNTVVEEHERRSTSSEGRIAVIEEQHHIFKDEHETFKERIKVAEQPGLVIKNVWRAIITLGVGATAMFSILKLLDKLKDL